MTNPAPDHGIYAGFRQFVYVNFKRAVCDNVRHVFSFACVPLCGVCVGRTIRPESPYRYRSDAFRNQPNNDQQTLHGCNLSRKAVRELFQKLTALTLGTFLMVKNRDRPAAYL